MLPKKLMKFGQIRTILAAKEHRYSEFVSAKKWYNVIPLS